MRYPTRAAAAMTVLALVVPVAPEAWAARGTIRCESRNYNRNFCRVDTENNVSLRRQLSNAPCQRNRTWGFDRSGIWVDRGRSADFDFGRSSGNSGNSNNNNAAIAAGILGALAIGAAIGNTQPVPPPPALVQPIPAAEVRSPGPAPASPFPASAPSAFPRASEAPAPSSGAVAAEVVG